MTQTISPSQAMLLLMEKYRDMAIFYDPLKRIYLNGIKNKEDKKFFEQMLAGEKDKLLAGYSVSYDSKVIDEDPSKRYFETHLAYATMTATSKKLNNVFLKNLYDDVFNKLNLNTFGVVSDATEKDLKLIKNFLDEKEDITKLLNHDSKSRFYKDNKQYFEEYGQAIKLLRADTGPLAGIPKEDKEKMIALLKITFMSIFIAQYRNDDLPFRIYGKGIFSPSQRGNKLKEDQGTTRSPNLGILKNYHPLPMNDVAFKDGNGQVRPADQGAYNEQSKWVSENFAELMHPYSNSISGTMLIQLSMIKYFMQRDETSPFHDKEVLTNYLKLFISTMLFMSGGHTLKEFTAVLQLDEIKNGFKSIPGFSNLDANNLFNVEEEENTKSGKEEIGNESQPKVLATDPFDAALDDTIAYNKTLLAKQKLNMSLKTAVDISSHDEKVKALKRDYQYFRQSLLNQLKKALYQASPVLYQKLLNSDNNNRPGGIDVLLSFADQKKSNGSVNTDIKTLWQDAIKKNSDLSKLLNKYAAVKILDDILNANQRSTVKLQTFKSTFASFAHLFEGRSNAFIQLFSFLKTDTRKSEKEDAEILSATRKHI